jgi:hypothetical protein
MIYFWPSLILESEAKVLWVEHLSVLRVGSTKNAGKGQKHLISLFSKLGCLSLSVTFTLGLFLWVRLEAFGGLHSRVGSWPYTHA